MAKTKKVIQHVMLSDFIIEVLEESLQAFNKSIMRDYTLPLKERKDSVYANRHDLLLEFIQQEMYSDWNVDNIFSTLKNMSEQYQWKSRIKEHTLTVPIEMFNFLEGVKYEANKKYHKRLSYGNIVTYLIWKYHYVDEKYKTIVN